MSNTVEFQKVWKKFRKGERFNSLRDAIPNMFRKIAKDKNGHENLEDQEFWAVKDVSFELKKGEVVGIIGPNGAGKSTILKLLSGIIVPNEGHMKIDGRLSALIEVTAGFHPELTGRENVYLNGTILGMKKKELDDRFDDIVEFSGIGEFIDTPVKRYSSGMFSRLGFSVAVHVNPDILLVDEVLAVGDIAFQSKCAEKMRELFNSGVTIVLVSHNIALIQSLCERVILLDKGEVLKEGAADDVIPYYEQLVFQERENALKQKISSSDKYKVKVNDAAAVVIDNVELLDEAGHKAKNFEQGSTMKIKVSYNALKELDQPVFSLDIMRADGVYCCASCPSDKERNFNKIKGKGEYEIEFGKINLAPGIYVAQLAIWEKDRIHHYVVKNDDIFNVELNGSRRSSKVVFVKDMKWKIN